MLFRQMLWLPRRVPVCVYERLGNVRFRSSLRLVFLGRLLISPILFLGAKGYFAYLSDRQAFRSKVFCDLQHIMAAASLDSTYCVVDWFMSKGRLLVYVVRNVRRIRSESNSPWKGVATWLRRRIGQPS